MRTAKAEKIAIAICIFFVLATASIIAFSPPGSKASTASPLALTQVDYYRHSTVAAGSININRASAEELCSLPGIGERLSERIIEYRRENGEFRYKDDLLDVKGIGLKMFEDIKEKIYV